MQTLFFTWAQFFSQICFFACHHHHTIFFFTQICSSLTLLSTQNLFFSQVMIFNWIWFLTWIHYFSLGWYFSISLFIIQKLFFSSLRLFFIQILLFIDFSLQQIFITAFNPNKDLSAREVYIILREPLVFHWFFTLHLGTILHMDYEHHCQSWLFLSGQD